MEPNYGEIGILLDITTYRSRAFDDSLTKQSMWNRLPTELYVLVRFLGSICHDFIHPKNGVFEF